MMPISPTLLTQTILAGAVPALAVAILLLALRRRVPAVAGITFLAMIVAFAAGVGIVTVFGLGDVEFGERLLRAAVWFFAVVLLARLLGYYTFELLLHRQWRVRVPPLLPRVSLGVLYLVGGLIVVTVAFPGANVGPLLATSAVTSLVLGLALQPILTNFFAGVVIALERPFRINDWIQVGEHEGKVTGITWRTTYIRTRENDTVILPNANIAQETLINFLYPHPLHMARIYVGVHYRTPPHRVRAAMLTAASRVKGVLENPSTDVYVVNFDDSAVTYELRAWVEDMTPLRRIESDCRQEIWEEFKRQGITIPFPIRTIEVAPRPRKHPAGECPPARLFVFSGAERGRSVEVGETAITVGRDAECQLVLSDRRVSSHHLTVVWEDGAFVLRDLESTHGTRVNGVAAKEVRLGNLDRIEVGDTLMAFEIDGD